LAAITSAALVDSSMATTAVLSLDAEVDAPVEPVEATAVQPVRRAAVTRNGSTR